MKTFCLLWTYAGQLAFRSFLSVLSVGVVAPASGIFLFPYVEYSYFPFHQANAHLSLRFQFKRSNYNIRENDNADIQYLFQVSTPLLLLLLLLLSFSKKSQHSIAVKTRDSGSRWPSFESALPFATVWPWETFLPSLNFSLPICKWG